MSEKKPVGPSKKNLLDALRDMGRNASQSKRLRELEGLKESAAEEMKKFMEKNETARQLAYLETKSSEEYYRTEREEREARSKKFSKIRIAVLTRGPTPAVVKMVEDLAAELR